MKSTLAEPSFKDKEVLRSRAKLAAGWVLSFTILVSDDMPKTIFEALEAMLQEAGRRVGIGDYRVEKKGPFGKFSVLQWAVSQL